MDRRLLLHQKLQASKQKKITIKEGDRLVTLNLKKDIIDPNIEIADKVLFMLEAFAEKIPNKVSETNNQPADTSATTTSPVVAAPSTETSPLSTKLISNIKSRDKVHVSPSKRVRFDFDKTSDDEMITSTPICSKNINVDKIPSQETSYTTENSQSKKEDQILNSECDAKASNTSGDKNETLDNNSSNTNTTSSSNNTLDELLNELDRTNSKLDEETTLIRKEMNVEANHFKEDQPKSTEDKTNTNKIFNAMPSNLLSSNVNNNNNNNNNESQTKVNNTGMAKKVKATHVQIFDQDLFKCRLCHLALNNQRALHEHVARIHGGKGGMFNSSLFASNVLDLYDIDDSEDGNEDVKSNEYNPKNKFTNKNASHPNVAIRVAKIAYYNSKITSSSQNSNAFKANIFQSGMRGNFFSQERLPLRSCKIKIKLKNNASCPASTENSIDNFINYQNRLSSIFQIDKNLTVTTQTNVRSDEKCPLLDSAEIRRFFRSLIVYIPINNSMRLNDLIEENNVLFKNEGLDLTESVKLIYEIILSSKQNGITLYDLKKEFDSKLPTLARRMLTFLQLIDILVKHFFILSVGVVERVYVAHQFKQHWVIQSVKNNKGRGSNNNTGCLYNSDDDDESRQKQINDSDLLASDDKLLELTEESDANKSVPRKRKQKSLEICEDKVGTSNQYRTVCLVPRPWRYIDGLLNRQVLEKMLETLIIHLKCYPNSTLDKIAEHFCPVLQPIMTLELLEMLESLRLVVRTVLVSEQACSLFSDFQNKSEILEDLNMAEGNETFTYYCKQKSIFTIKKIFQR